MLPIGRYSLEVVYPVFRLYRRTGIVIDANSALVINAALQPGQRNQSITVTDSAVHVETTSTQMGETISGRQMNAVPLNGRSFTDLLSLQPGVVPATSVTSGTVQDVGASVFSPSGDLNPGTISINGQREFANAFIVNGSDAEEDVNMGTSIIPNLDSIAEFHIVINNLDAEYGEFSGGQIEVITKSGSNSFHDDVFEFLRNTDLDARNYFSPTRGVFQQNQYGATVGGPIRPNKVFFFADYQGTRQNQGVDTGSIAVPSSADRAGDLSDRASSLTGVVSGPYLASLLSQRLGYAVTSSESYYASGCVTSSQCVFPNGISRFSTGFPITLVNNSDYSLLGTNPNGVNNSNIDEPEYSGGSLNLNSNPRDGLPYFNPSVFSLQPLSTPANSPRRPWPRRRKLRYGIE